MWCYTILNFYFVIILQYSSNCICSYNNDTSTAGRLKGETGDIKEKRQLHLEEYGSFEFLIDPEPTDMDTKRNTNQTYIVTNVTSTELNNIDRDENITSIEINDMTIPSKNPIQVATTAAYTTTTENIITTELTMNTIVTTSTEETTTEKVDQTAAYCPKYKKTKDFDFNKMADVWKITFYTIPTTLKCFRLHIKSLTYEDQKQWEAKYGDFNYKVKWNNCILEISSSDHNRIGVQRKHYLQKNESHYGVLDNMIIDQERAGNTTAVLHEESPDQWLVVKNLLLMRDCNTGDIVIFSRVPSEPLMSDIESAMAEFGESGPVNGTRACEGFVKAWVKVGREMQNGGGATEICLRWRRGSGGGRNTTAPTKGELARLGSLKDFLPS